MSEHPAEWDPVAEPLPEHVAVGWAGMEDRLADQVQFAIHLHYVREHLKAEDRVLEMGAGRGRFTRELAALSRRVVVADVSAEKLQVNQRNMTALGLDGAVEAWVECDMTKLQGVFDDGSFDAVVCYGGPLSYVFDRRFKALAELVRVTKRGGLLFLSARSLFGTVHESLPRVLSGDPRVNREIIRTGDIGPDKVGVARNFLHAYRSGEFRAAIEGAGAEVVVLSASECVSATWGDLVAPWQDDPEVWKHLLEIELEACREPGCLDMGSHILAVARKR